MIFVVEKIALGQGFFEYCRFLSVYYYTNVPYSPSVISFTYQKDKWATPNFLPKSKALSEIKERKVDQNLHFHSYP